MICFAGTSLDQLWGLSEGGRLGIRSCLQPRVIIWLGMCRGGLSNISDEQDDCAETRPAEVFSYKVGMEERTGGRSEEGVDAMRCLVGGVAKRERSRREAGRVSSCSRGALKVG